MAASSTPLPHRDVLEERVRVAIASFRTLHELIYAWWERGQVCDPVVADRKTNFYYELTRDVQRQVQETMDQCKVAGIAIGEELEDVANQLRAMTAFTPAEAQEALDEIAAGRHRDLEALRRELPARHR